MKNAQTWTMVAGYFAIFILIFYVFAIMPRKKQEKKHSTLLESLKKGDKVVTIGGINGVIARVKDDTLMLKVNENMEIELLKKAIAYRVGDE